MSYSAEAVKNVRPFWGDLGGFLEGADGIFKSTKLLVRKSRPKMRFCWCRIEFDSSLVCGQPVVCIPSFAQDTAKHNVGYRRTSAKSGCRLCYHQRFV